MSSTIRWLLVVAFFSFGNVFAADAATDAINPEAAAELVKTLEDPAARDKLIEQLKLLTESAQPEQTPVTEVSAVKQALDNSLSRVSKRVDKLADAAIATLVSVRDLPALYLGFQLNLEDRRWRESWLAVLIHLFSVVAAATLAYWLFALVLSRIDRALDRGVGNSLFAKLGGLASKLLVGIIPLAAFLGAAYATLGFLDANDLVRALAFSFVHATVLLRLLTLGARFILAPDTAALRIPAIDDEAAYYGLIWVRRIGGLAIYGFFALKTASALGLADAVYLSLMQILGLMVAALAIMLVAQNRQAISNLIYPRNDAASDVDKLSLRRRLAPFWHWFAGAYVFALYLAWTLSDEGGFLWLARATVITLAAFGVGLVALGSLKTAFKRGFKINKDLTARFPDLEARANRYISVVHGVLRGLVIFLVLLTILSGWGVNTFGWLISDSGQAVTGTMATILFIVIVSLMLWEFGNSAITRNLSETDMFGRPRTRSARTLTLLTVARNVLRISLMVITTLMVLAQLNVNITPLLAGAGVIGVALGFGSQTLVKDIIGGAFILFEDTISVGDIVDVGGGNVGTVEAVTIRQLRLRAMDGSVHTVPYSSISTITNMTKDFSFYVLNVGVSYQEDIDHVMGVLKELGDELQLDEEFGPRILEPLEVLGLNAFEDSAVVIRARIKTLPSKQWGVGREFNRRMKRRFDELAIEIPYPHQTLFIGADRRGKTNPLEVSFKDLDQALARYDARIESRGRPASTIDTKPEES